MSQRGCLCSTGLASSVFALGLAFCVAQMPANNAMAATPTLSPSPENAAPGSMLNDPPLAVADTFSVLEGVTTELFVLDNDSDPDGDPLDVFIVGAPVHGTALAPTLGSVFYTPVPGYSGPDSFVYRACDIGIPVLCADAKVHLNVLTANLPPIVRADTAVTLRSFSVRVQVLNNDEDPEGAGFSSVIVVDQPTHGSATPGALGQINYVPNPSFVGMDSFRYEACDVAETPLCARARVFVRVDELYLPDSFSPNGDGLFDTYTIDGVLAYPDNALEIFDRWGRVIFNQNAYANTWNGISEDSGEPLPEDVYYYRFRLPGLGIELSGSIVLKR
ncbi:MAG: T9SS type B sorting domain-containing protein [Bacteroidetes bacterium]|nr:T9SS type B sorting domain-containing protein [Bacteroidota bacterium]